MKLTDKRFWIFEVIVLICTIICVVVLWIEHWLRFDSAAIGFFCLFLVGGAVAWKLYKGDQWWKLAGYMFLVTTVFLAIVLFGFVWDWNDNGGRPANIPPDEGHYITSNELVGIIMLLWSIIAPVLSCAISLLTRRLVIKRSQRDKLK